MKSLGGILAGILFAALMSARASAAPCESLASLSLPDGKITLAQTVAAGTFKPPEGDSEGMFKTLPAFCRVAATLNPSGDSEIKIEVWMRAAGWNGKYMGVGNGGWAGTIRYNAMRSSLARGYAVASTNTGHDGVHTDASFALGHLEKLTDFAYRAVHEMTVSAKTIVAAFYGEAPKFSYWNGCSTGGRQGLMEVQRFPADYDGVISGAPANNLAHLEVANIWISQAVHKDAASFIPPAKYPLIHDAVMQSCDELDGVKDGILENPTLCKFDPMVLKCKGGGGPDCLTGPQAEAARKIYGPVKNWRTGEEIYPGLPRGTELQWGIHAGAEPTPLAFSGMRYVVFKDRHWDYMNFNFDSDIALAERTQEQIVATSPDVKAFFDHGGKLIQYHGWSDPLISAQNSVDYYRSVIAKMGDDLSKLNNSYRLFMVPGMDHCGGGHGPDQFDMVGALEAWVERGEAPASVVASHAIAGKVDRTRPLCPYPQVAAYSGKGSIDIAANFSCALAKEDQGR
jgi:feruloyl esterase